MSKFVAWLFCQSDRSDAVGRLAATLRGRPDFPTSLYRIGALLRWAHDDDDLRRALKIAHREYHRGRR